MRRLLLASLLAGPVAAQQADLVTVAVRQAATGAPLPNAEVLPGGRAPSRLTDARGELRLPWSGSLRLVVRQIGFAPLDTTLAARPMDGRVVLQLNPVAYRLPALVATTVRGCPDAVSREEAERTAVILEQLQINAEHFEAFRREYRWEVLSERRTVQVPTQRTTELALERQPSKEWGAPYRRGRVFERRGLTRDEDGWPRPIERQAWWATLLFVNALAARAFWDSHCFRALGSDPADTMPMVRLAFTPRSFVRSIDWRGTAILDSATAELRRVEFELVNLETDLPPTRLAGATDFVRVSPYVMVPASTVARFWDTDTALVARPDLPDRVQRLQTMTLRWIGPRPPGVDSLTVVDSTLVAWHEEYRRAQAAERRRPSGPPADTVEIDTASPVRAPRRPR